MAQLELLKAAAAPPDLAHKKADDAYKTISEVSEELGVPQHVLRFWEAHFPQVKPSRMRGSRRYYRPEDIDLLKKIKILLYSQGYTIKGAQKVVKDKDILVELPEEGTKVKAPEPKVNVEAAPDKGNAHKPDIKTLISELRILKGMLGSL